MRCYHFAVRTAKSHSIAKASLDAKYSRVLVESYSIRGFEHGIAHEIIALAASGRVSEAEELLPMVRTFCESAERVEAAAAEMFATNRQAAEWVLQKLIERVFDVREAARLREKLEKLRSSPPPAPPSPVQAAFPASLKWIEDLAIAGSIAEARAELNASKKKAATTTTASRSRLPAKRWRTVSATNIQLPPAGSTRCPHRVSAICIVR